MFLIRLNKKTRVATRKGIAWFFMLIMVTTIFQPLNSLAITGSEIQMEYGSYESSGNSDMVNLLTGDFSYNLPIIHVPSPEGGFTMPLFYHAGIGVEQDASWVGLGWGMNPGAITRSPNNIPDDYSGEDVEVYSTYDGPSGWTFNGLLFNLGYDSELGNYGGVNILSVVGANWGAGTNSFTLAGLSMGKDGVSWKPEQTIMAAMTIASIGSAASASAVADAAKTGVTAHVTAGNIASAIGSNLAMDVGMGLAFAGMTNSTANYSQGMWVKTTTSSFFLKENYKWNLDHHANEKSYGVLYQNEMPVDVGESTEHERIKILNSSGLKYMDEIQWHNREGQEVYANYQCAIKLPLGCEDDEREQFKNKYINEHPYKNDVYMYQSNTGEAHAWNSSPTHLSLDNFNVMGEGVSGGISPYRLDIGSAAIPYNYPETEVKHVKKFEDYKVGFRYLGDAGKGYTNHYTNNHGTTLDINQTNGKVDITLNITDNKLNDVDGVSIGAASNVVSRLDGSVTTKKVMQGKNIEWYSNADISNGTAIVDGGFLDFLTAGERASFRANLPQKGIGGFCVTREDGFTYHFALPVYNKYKKFYNGTDNNNKTEVIHDADYATSWLLTGITGPDFIDKGGVNDGANGVLDDSDLGYWVRFGYGKFSGGYNWSQPYDNKGFQDNGNEGNVSLSGTHESYFLNTIRTRTHTGMFVKGKRYDGKGKPTVSTGQASSSLKLDDVYVLKNEDFDALHSTLGFTLNANGSGANAELGNGDTYDNVYDTYDISNTFGASEFIKVNAVRDIRFTYDNSLCDNTPNSYYNPKNPPSDPASLYGKLTLKSLSVYGQGGIELFPPFLFDYGYNPTYEKYKYDSWGMYSSRGTNNAYTHDALQPSSDAAAWSLKKITMPNGTELEVEYERDDYISVAGEPVRVVLPVGSRDYNNRTIATVNNDQTRIMGGRSEDNLNIQNYLPSDYLIIGQPFNWGYTLTGVLLRNPLTGEWQSANGDGHPADQPEFNPDIVTALDDSKESFGAGYLTALNSGNENIKLRYVVAENMNAVYKGGTVGRKGDKLRVKKLITRNGDKEFVREYRYTQDGSTTGLSSGVVGSEPVSPTRFEHWFYKRYDHPNTGVMYSKVTVLDGVKPNGDFTSKVQYDFVTPHVSQIGDEFIDENTFQQKVDNLIIVSDCGEIQKVEQRHKFIDIKTSQIGRASQIKVYDAKNFLINKTTFGYNETPFVPENYGVYSEGTLFTERTNVPELDGFYCFGQGYNISGHEVPIFKHVRTTKRYFPSILTSVNTQSNYSTTKTFYGPFNEITGEPIHTSITDEVGKVYFTSNLTAKVYYDKMGSKAVDLSNKNMLTQGAVSDLQTSVESGYLDSKVQTWTENSLVRSLTSSGEYENVLSPIPRTKASYIWDHPLVNSLGEYVDFVPFSFTKELNNEDQGNSWLKASENTLFDDFSHVLEVKDVNGNYATTEYDVNGNYSIASTSFAQQPDAGYTGFENTPVGTQNYLDGEFKLISGNLSTEKKHTGTSSLEIQANQVGLMKSIPASEYNLNRNFYTQFWVHESNYDKATLYFKRNNLTGTVSNSWVEVQVNTLPCDKFGEWYLVEYKYTQTMQSTDEMLEFGIKSTNGVVYVDDVRLLPYESSMGAQVLDDQNRVWYKLGNRNTYVRYEYNDKGEVAKVYVETPEGEKLVSESERNYSRN